MDMPSDRTFETLPPEELLLITQQRRNICLRANRSTICLEHIEQDFPDLDLSRPFSVPQYPSQKEISRACSDKTDERPARWLVFYFSTYFQNGQIRFRKLNETTFEVQVMF